MKNISLKRAPMLFLQSLIILIGIAVLAFLLWEPSVEGVNVNKTFFEIYFQDPFVAYAYISSIAFFLALYKAFTLLTYIGQNKIFSQDSVKALRMIQYCGIYLAVVVGGAIIYLLINIAGSDDIAGGVAMGLVVFVLSILMTTTAIVCEGIVQNAVDGK